MLLIAHITFVNDTHCVLLLNYRLNLDMTCKSILFLQVRTKSRDSQSSDSAPTPIPPAVLRGVASRVPRGPGPGPAQPVSGYRGQRPQPYQQHQQVIEHDENLSDKEIFPSSNRPNDPQTTQVKIYLFKFVCIYF